MRRPTVAAALLIALALGGFGPPGTAAAQPPGIGTAAAQPPGIGTAAARPAVQPPGGVAACLDGNCTLRVTGPVEIPLDGRVGPTKLSVSSIGRFAVAFRVHSASGVGLGVVGRSGTVRFTSTQGTLAVRVLELGPDAAVIELSTEPA